MRYYLDHNAGSPVETRVLQRFLEVEAKAPANPGSLHGSGRASQAALEDARAQVAAALGVAPTEVFFVSGGTEANNLAVVGSGDPGRPVLLAEVERVVPALCESLYDAVQVGENDAAGAVLLDEGVGESVHGTPSSVSQGRATSAESAAAR